MKSKKEKVWEQTREKVDKTTDALGKKVDRKIKEAVTALMIWKFPTSLSCQGHIVKLEKRLLRLKKVSHFKPFPNFMEPFIEIYTKAPKNWRSNKKKEKKWTKDNLAQKKRMEKTLGEFYQKRKKSGDTKLVLENIGIFGAFRLHNKGGGKADKLSLAKQKEKLELFQKEFQDFADFLKEKYFNQRN